MVSGFVFLWVLSVCLYLCVCAYVYLFSCLFCFLLFNLLVCFLKREKSEGVELGKKEGGEEMVGGEEGGEIDQKEYIV